MTKLNTELERLVAVETKLDTVIEQTQKLNDKLDLLLPTFVTQKQLEDKLIVLEKTLLEVSREAKSRRIVRDVLLMVLTSTISFLLFFFLNSFV